MSNLSAYFFFMDFKDNDPNESIPEELLSKYRDEGNSFESAMKDFFEANHDDPQFMLYEVAKRHFGESGADIRRFFRRAYQLFYENENGTRLGTFVQLLGMEEFKNMYDNFSRNPFRISYFRK